MAKLTKYTNFEAFKSDTKSDIAPVIKDKKLMLEFEAFLNLLQNKFLEKKETKTTDGKQFR